MPGGGRAVKTGRTRPWPMPLGSRDGMSKAPAIYCRGRADGVRGDEATYLSMTVRHGHSRRARRPLATASLFSAAPPRPAAGRTPWSCWSPALSQSATLTSGPARCPRRAATGSGRRPCVASTLCWPAGMGEIYSACRKTSGEWKIAALLGFNRIWRHVRQIRKKPCVARVSLHSSLAAP